MRGRYEVANARDLESIRKVSNAITAWDPLLSLKFTRDASLYHGVLVGYGLWLGDAATIRFRDRSQRVSPGDAIVLAPSVRIAAQPVAEVLSICYEGLAPQHLRGAEGLSLGFDYFAFEGTVADKSICGHRRQIIPQTDLRYRLHYHYVDIQNAQPHTHSDMVELYYVHRGEGTVQIGPAMDQLTPVPIGAGQLLVVGPDLFHVPSDGLGACIWFLYSEAAHRRRLRESIPKQ